ncbi:MAG: hypothetical protein HY319_04760 [Armatimonadetes bacterium]|nr:hypothetical protein [Armatimonadota bacterium]
MTPRLGAPLSLLAAFLLLFSLGCSTGGGGDDPTLSVAVSRQPTIPGQGTRVFVSAEACQNCHGAIYADFRQTGHPYKLNKVVNGQMPTYPYSSIAGALERITGAVNSLGAPQSYADVSYVIGGFGWKARWMDRNGFIVTGTGVQYNLDDGSMSAYNAAQVDKKYDCGECHTTGWRPFDAALNPNRQDNLPGMEGTFHSTGVQCEACHGLGGIHVATMNKADIVRKATPRTKAELEAADQAYGRAIACSECHTRDGERNHANGYVSPANAAGFAGVGGRIMAAGGLIQHHEQFDELLAIDPDNTAAGSTRMASFQTAKFTCTACHDQHKVTIYKPGTPGRVGGGPGVKSSNADCMTCHPNNDPAQSKHPAMAHLNCIDCHMPKMVKSATSRKSGGAVPVNIGDIKTHIFRINLSKTDASQFTADGKFAYPYLTAQFACHQCHDGTRAHDRTDRNESGFDFH